MTIAVAKRPRTRTKTLVVNFVLDETGSMSSCRDATISGFNEYVGELLKRKEKLLFTLTTFNSDEIKVRHAGVAVADVELLNLGNYNPASMTPLYDAIARTVKATEQALKSQRGKPNVLCVIMTDGEENASHEYKREDIFGLITEKRDDGWEFAFLGANQDAWETGQGMGLDRGSTVSYTNDAAGTHTAMAAASTMTLNYADNTTRAASFGGKRHLDDNS